MHNNRYLRALVPGCVFDDASIDNLAAVFQANSGVLNVLTPGVPYESSKTVDCPVYPSVGALPSWAKEELGVMPQQRSRRQVLEYIISSTRESESVAPALLDETNVLESEETLDRFQLDESRFCFYWNEGELNAISSIGKFEIERYDLTRNIFSRNTGILETDIMSNKRAVILGCGSVGSLVAAELARAGVGNFLLIDMDVLEYHNICRHQCGVADVGRYKPDAVRDLIHNINPRAIVETSCVEVQQTSRELLGSWCVPGETIVFGCADNRDVDRYGNDVAADFGVAFLGVGFWERAFAGEIFYWIPGERHACYRCALGDDDGMSQRVEANHHVYTTQTDLAAVNFEPGISVDIDFVTIIGVKLALDIFNRGDSRFTQRLLPHLSQYTLVCNTNNPAVGGDMAEIFSYPLQVTTSLRVTPKAGCAICGTLVEDDE